MEPGNSDDNCITPVSGCIPRNAFFHYQPWLRAGLYWWLNTDFGVILQVLIPTLGSGQQFLSWYYTSGPGSLDIFHHFICWYRYTYTLPPELPPYILSFLICQQGEGRWGVNRMHLWPLLAWFTCPLHSEHHLFAFLPGVTPVLTGRQEFLCTPGQLDSWISLSAASNIQETAAPDGSSQQNHQHRNRLLLPKFTRGPILTSVLHLLKHTEVTKVGVWCNSRENLLSRMLCKSRCWKRTVSFCFGSPVCVYYFSWSKHWSSPF